MPVRDVEFYPTLVPTPDRLRSRLTQAGQLPVSENGPFQLKRRQVPRIRPVKDAGATV
jgi:hypothetical protein